MNANNFPCQEAGFESVTPAPSGRRDTGLAPTPVRTSQENGHRLPRNVSVFSQKVIPINITWTQRCSVMGKTLAFLLTEKDRKRIKMNISDGNASFLGDKSWTPMAVDNFSPSQQYDEISK